MDCNADLEIERRRERGVTLVELMVSLAIGLLLVIAMSAIFVGSSVSRREIDMSADVIESGRYGVDVLTRELAQSGFFGTLVTPPGTTNNPCSTNVVAHWKTSLSIHVAGLNNAPATPLAPWDCVAPKADTDVIFIQRASTCAVGEAGCEAENDDNAYLQVTDCGEEYSALMPNPFVLAAGGSGSPAGTFNMQNKECDGATFAPKRKLIRRIYYVSADEVLSYIDIRSDGVQDPVQLAENIEQMQIEYGIASADSAGTPVSFTAMPTAAELPFIVGARVWLLARSTVASRNTKNALTFEMSDKTVEILAASSNQKRRVYNTYIPFVTPKSRREAS
jgi:type IV pilus assembly protein PilW